MPETTDRRSYDDEQYPGYLESDTDWALNNWEAVNWLAENHALIRSALSKDIRVVTYVNGKQVHEVVI